jgi:hypothetical protein
MAKKSSGFIGTFGGNPKSRLSNVLAGDRTGRGKPAKIISTVHNAGVLQSARLGAPVTRMGAYAQRKDLPPGSIDIRGYFGDERTGIRKTAGQKIASALNVGAVDKKAKPADVVRTTTNMKTSPVKTTPAQRVVMDKNPMGPRKTAAGKNASFGFASTKDMGARAMGALGGLARGAMSGGLKSSPGSPARAAQARAMNKNSVAGPSKTASGKNASFGFGGGKGGKKK